MSFTKSINNYQSESINRNGSPNPFARTSLLDMYNASHKSDDSKDELDEYVLRKSIISQGPQESASSRQINLVGGH